MKNQNRTGPAVVIALCWVIFSASAVAAENSQRILVFGDSISWGWIPSKDAVPTQRYASEDRWPTVMGRALGDQYKVIVNAVSGRTTDLDDPTFPALKGAGLNGSKSLPAVIAAHVPLDLVIIFLGTNDLKQHFRRSAFDIALGAGKLVSIVQSSGKMFGSGWYDYPAPKVLLLAPPPLGEQGAFGDLFSGGGAKSTQLAKQYEMLARSAGVAFFDTADVIETDGVDGVHLSKEAEKALGQAVAKKVDEVLGQ